MLAYVYVASGADQDSGTAAAFLLGNHVFAVHNDGAKYNGKYQSYYSNDQSGGKFRFVVSHEALQNNWVNN
ncbi:hypothetical protein GCM10027278_25360 [Paralcaligenes ginsengisoli]